MMQHRILNIPSKEEETMRTNLTQAIQERDNYDMFAASRKKEGKEST